MRGPRGASVERQAEIKQTLTWSFTADYLRKRLSLPPGTVFYVSCKEGEIDASPREYGCVQITISDSSANVSLTAQFVETRSPKEKL